MFSVQNASGRIRLELYFLGWIGVGRKRPVAKVTEKTHRFRELALRSECGAPNSGNEKKEACLFV